MKVILSKRAAKLFKKLPTVDQIILTKKIRYLQTETKTTQFERLQGYQNIFRLRVGHYRIVFKKFPDRFYIILIGHRKDIYKILDQIL